VLRYPWSFRRNKTGTIAVTLALRSCGASYGSLAKMSLTIRSSRTGSSFGLVDTLI
jgi:hypothetical protein